MTLAIERFWLRVAGFIGLVLAAGALSGCGRDEIQVYRVPKESTGTAVAALAGPGPTTGRPQVTWTTPTGWESLPPSEMRLASFRVKGDAKLADISIVPLPGMAGSDLANVNRWRDQAGQPPVTEGELATLGEDVDIGGRPGRLYDQAGLNSASGERVRILAAVQRRDNVAWFIKMTGDEGLVGKQQPIFVQFLKSLVFAPAAAASQDVPVARAAAAAPAVSTNSKRTPREGTPPEVGGTGHPAWTVPAGWKEIEAGQMLVAKFSIPGSGGAGAELNVSMLAGAGGGVAANVNRWRGQLGLAPLAENEVEKQVQSVPVNQGKALVVDLKGTDARTGQPARMLAAIVPQNDRTWFYKMMGAESVVEREKAAFTSFLQSMKD